MTLPVVHANIQMVVLFQCSVKQTSQLSWNTLFCKSCWIFPIGNFYFLISKWIDASGNPLNIIYSLYFIFCTTSLLFSPFSVSYFTILMTALFHLGALLMRNYHIYPEMDFLFSSVAELQPSSTLEMSYYAFPKHRNPPPWVSPGTKLEEGQCVGKDKFLIPSGT